MNYNNSGNTHSELCDNLRKNNLISTQLIEYAFRKADRAIFDPSESPYEDKPHSIGGGATITSAHMHAIALESLGDALTSLEDKNLRFLDVGCGSGYVTGVMGMIIHTISNSATNKETNNGKIVGKAIGVDIVPQLVQQSLENIQALNPLLVDEKEPICEVLSLDAFTENIPHGPFNAIHVGVAAIDIPHKLLSQLKVNGKAIIPVYIKGTPEQDLFVFTRKTLESLPDDVAEYSDWLERNFGKKIVMRCMYSPPLDASSIPHLPAINPRDDMKIPSSQYSKFFKTDNAVRESPEAMAERKKKIKAKELDETRARLSTEVKQYQDALDITAEEIKSWHASFLVSQNRKPLMADMKADPHISKLLDIVHELRGKIQKNERALKALKQ